MQITNFCIQNFKNRPTLGDFEIYEVDPPNSANLIRFLFSNDSLCIYLYIRTIYDFSMLFFLVLFIFVVLLFFFFSLISFFLYFSRFFFILNSEFTRIRPLVIILYLNSKKKLLHMWISKKWIHKTRFWEDAGHESQVYTQY